MKKFLTLILVSFYSHLNAQKLNTFVINPISINPAFVSVKSNPELWLNYTRIGYEGLIGNQMNGFVSMNLKNNANLGFQFSKGFGTNNGLEVSSNLNVATKNGDGKVRLSVGTQLGYGSRQLSPEIRYNYYNLGLNSLLFNKHFFVGLNVPQILRNETKIERIYTLYTRTPIYSMCGFNIPISGEISLHPTFLLGNFKEYKKMEKTFGLHLNSENKFKLGINFNMNNMLLDDSYGDNYLGATAVLTIFKKTELGFNYNKMINRIDSYFESKINFMNISVKYRFKE